MKKKLVNWVLINEINSFKYFIEDFEGGSKASQAFVMDLITKIDYSIYKPKDVIIHYGEEI